MAEDYKVQLSLNVPPKTQGQYEKGDMLNIRATSAEELKTLLIGTAGMAKEYPILGRFFGVVGPVPDTTQQMDQAEAALKSGDQPLVEPETKADEATFGTCPECGQGQLRERDGKYGPFKGCNRYPDCKFILKEKK